MLKSIVMCIILFGNIVCAGNVNSADSKEFSCSTVKDKIEEIRKTWMTESQSLNELENDIGSINEEIYNIDVELLKIESEIKSTKYDDTILKYALDLKSAGIEDDEIVDAVIRDLQYEKEIYASNKKTNDDKVLDIIPEMFNVKEDAFDSRYIDTLKTAGSFMGIEDAHIKKKIDTGKRKKLEKMMDDLNNKKKKLLDELGEIKRKRSNKVLNLLLIAKKSDFLLVEVFKNKCRSKQ